jgi:DNA-binding HxlR family transcriptional regulator
MKGKTKKGKLNIALSPAEFCPIRQTVRLLGKQWTLLIIKELYFSRWHRASFMELRKRLLDASSKVLSERLKEMAHEGIVRRREAPDAVPPRVFYYLTPKGMDACKIVEGFKAFGLKWGTDTFDCRKVECELCTKERDAGRIPDHHLAKAKELSALTQ